MHTPNKETVSNEADGGQDGFGPQPESVRDQDASRGDSGVTHEVNNVASTSQPLADGSMSGVEVVRAKRAKRMQEAHAASHARAAACLAVVDQAAADIEDGKARSAKQSANVVAHGMAWRRFVMTLENGTGREVDAIYGPTLTQIQEYVAYMFTNRVNYSTAGKEGVSQSYKHQVPGQRMTDGTILADNALVPRRLVTRCPKRGAALVSCMATRVGGQ